MSEPKSEPSYKELAAANAKLREENEALRAECATLAAGLDAARASAKAAVEAEEVYVLMCGLHHDGKQFRAGDFLPFDPARPPKGSEGLVEGVHYRKERVLRAKG